MKNSQKVNRNKVPTPQPQITSEALEQIILIKQHDFTLQEKSFRIAIKGKECDGFTYEAYFDQQNEDDFKILFEKKGQTIELIFDPFSAFYLKHVKVDYKISLEDNTDGFIIDNPDQDQHTGKFWVRKGASKPPLL